MKLTAMAAMLLLAAGGVMAEDNATDFNAAGWRLGGSVSYAKYDTDDGTVHDGGAGFKGFATYRLNQWIGFEGSFFVSPEFDADLTPNVAGGETETTYQGITFYGIGFLPSPVERMDFYLKGGYFNFFDLTVKTDNVTTDTGSDDGLALGIGTAIDAGDNIGIRVEAHWYDTTGADLWTIDIGAEYRF